MALTFGNIQQSAKTALQADAVLNTVAILVEDGAADNDRDAVAALQTGKGVVIIIQRPQKLDKSDERQRAISGELFLPITIQEKVTRNRSDNGTGETILELIDRMFAAMLGAPSTMGKSYFRAYDPPAVNLGNEDGLEEWVINFAGHLVITANASA